MIGVKHDGKKELVVLQGGYRESSESWAELLRDLKWRWIRAPVLRGQWGFDLLGAIRDVFLASRCQRDWVQKPPRCLTPSCQRAGIEWSREGDLRDHRGRKQEEGRAAIEEFIKEFGVVA
jgi:putative transposase